MAPTASPGFRQTAIELNYKLFSAVTPSKAEKLRNGSGFVSWKNIIHFFPYFNHFYTEPLIYNKV
jgi:hypothetical protein